MVEEGHNMGHFNRFILNVNQLTLLDYMSKTTCHEIDKIFFLLKSNSKSSLLIQNFAMF